MDINTDVLCDTLLHISEVAENIVKIRYELRCRSKSHDRSKLQEPEFSACVSTRPRFKEVNYGSPEYEELVEEIKPAVEHHYKNNRHHTLFHKNGINDMNLRDIMEMLADWKAAERRSPDKSLADTLDYAFERYKISPQLGQILKNTLNFLKWID